MIVDIEHTDSPIQVFSLPELFRENDGNIHAIYKLHDSHSDKRFITIRNGSGAIELLCLEGSTAYTIVNRPGTITYGQFNQYKYVKCSSEERLVLRNSK